ncbi:hypothetical protein [Nocardia gipuzkoensis]|uniref:hypothetical protein n=1 Tax=Nocardia gipuzkoensis TaxID=2749991 RepID=UPI003EE13E91
MAGVDAVFYLVRGHALVTQCDRSHPHATATLAEYGKVSLGLALRGIEPKTRDPYLAGWRRRVLPTVGHLPVTMITAGVADRAVGAWIADGCSKSTVKNTLAVWGRVMDQAVRDELIDRNPVQVPGWQR